MVFSLLALLESISQISRGTGSVTRTTGAGLRPAPCLAPPQLRDFGSIAPFKVFMSLKSTRPLNLQLELDRKFKYDFLYQMGADRVTAYRHPDQTGNPPNNHYQGLNQ